jgi:uncharacterized membrane protein YfcA
VNIRALLASPLGFLIGVSLGALGGGGSILAVPALVYGAGQTTKEAATTSLLLVGVTSAIGAFAQWRLGRVRLLPGVVFGIAGVGGSLLGSKGHEQIDADVLLLAFSIVMFIAAYSMWRRTKKSPDSSATENETEQKRFHVSVELVVKVLIVGSFVGAMTGFFGVGGGFIIVPALVLVLGFAMPEAVGTSLVVITINSAVAFLARVGNGTLDWSVIIPFMIAGLLGMATGTKIGSSTDPVRLQRWFVALLVVIASWTCVASAIAVAKSA